MGFYLSNWKYMHPKFKPKIYMILLSVTAAPCVKTIYFYWAQLTALSNLEALQKQMQNTLQFEFLNYDTFRTQFVFTKVKVCSNEDFFGII